MEPDAERSTAVLAHVGAVFLPVVAPAVLFVLKRQNRFIRAHAVVALFSSVAWVVSAVAVISVDLGQLSIDETETSSTGLAALLVVFVAMLAFMATNVSRANAGRPPVGR